MKKIYFVLVCLLGFTIAGAQSLVQNFEGYSVGDDITWTGWGESDAISKVADDPFGAQNKALRFEPKNYNAVPYLEFELPAGKSMADYASFTFNGHFAQGDVGWKTVYVAAFSAAPTSGFQGDNPNIIGQYYRDRGASSDWEVISMDITGNASMTGIVYIAFGVSTAGTGDQGGTGLPTVWYADNVKLVDPTATSAAEVKISSSVFVAGRNIVVNGAAGQNVSVYSLTGAKIFEVASAGSTVEVTVPVGVYVVAVGGATQKVVVK